MQIWKWGLRITDVQAIEMPIGAKLLDVQVQHDMPQVWALCDETAPKAMRWFVMHGTGNMIDEVPGPYIGTFQLQNGQFVFHLFERKI